MIGTDGFQEADTVGITRPCTKMNWLVKDTAKLAETIHLAFHVATHGRPGPVLIDIPKDVQFADSAYVGPDAIKTPALPAPHQGRPGADPASGRDDGNRRTPGVLYRRRRDQLRPHRRRRLLRDLVAATDFPITSTLMGLGSYPASGKNWLGMLGMHGLYEANLAMHGCDLMINIGARFDDRITGRIKDFIAPFAQGPYRHRPVVDQQGHPCRCRHRRRRGRGAGRGAGAVEAARVAKPTGRPSANGGARSAMAGRQMPDLQELDQDDQTAIRAGTAGGADQGHGPLYHAPRSASTRCGPRSSWGSRTRTAG